MANLTIGVPGPYADNTTSANERGDRTGATVVTDAHGRYYEASARGKIFGASTQSAIALSLLSSTSTGFILMNPPNSNINIALLDVSVALATAPAGAAPIYLCTVPSTAANCVTTHSTPLVVRCLLLPTTATGNALVDSAATLQATPVVIRALGGGPVASSMINPAFIRDDIAGEIVLGPNSCIAISALTTAISAVVSMAWEEIPI
jgi:hypothetical protein